MNDTLAWANREHAAIMKAIRAKQRRFNREAVKYVLSMDGVRPTLKREIPAVLRAALRSAIPTIAIADTPANRRRLLTQMAEVYTWPLYFKHLRRGRVPKTSAIYRIASDLQNTAITMGIARKGRRLR